MAAGHLDAAHIELAFTLGVACKEWTLASKWIRKTVLSKHSIFGGGLLRVHTGLEMASKQALLDFVAVGVVLRSCFGCGQQSAETCLRLEVACTKRKLGNEVALEEGTVCADLP